jgi:moderate conductance mechanosensitive channel
MSTGRGVPNSHGWMMRCGRPISWMPASWIMMSLLVLTGIALTMIPPAAGAPAGGNGSPAVVSSVTGATLQPSLQLQVISTLNVVRDDLHGNLAAVTMAPVEALRLQADTTSAWRNGDILRGAIYSIVLLMIGGGAEWLYWCYAGKTWRATAEAAEAGREALPPARAAVLGLRRAALAAIGVMLFVGGVLVPSSVFAWPAGVQAGIVAAALAITSIRAASIASAFILSPHLARLRLVALPNKSARRLNLALVALSAAFAGGYSAQSLLRTTLGTPGLATIASAGSGIVAATLSLIVLRLWLSAFGAKRSSSLYPIALTSVVLLCLALHLIGVQEFVQAALLWVAAVIIGKTALLIVEAFTSGTGEATLRAAEYRSVLKSGIRIIVFGAATAATAMVWSIPLLQISQSPTFVGRLLARSFDVFVVILIADLVWVWARTIIDGKLAAVPMGGGEQGGPDPSARLATLLPLLRKVILGLLLGLVGMILLSALGVDIAPLLAGAGVVGIAIGLGAQTLVRDIVSGVFYLIADSFRVGEYVESGEIRGKVEGISLRFLRIRHHGGAVHTVPFGEIKWLTNHSRDWAVMKLEFCVPFETDVALVKRIADKIGAELKADPEFGPHMIEPLESRGIVRMEEFGMVMGVKCTTNPGEGQFNIRRESYHRIRDAFEEHGIRFARRNVDVQVASEHGEMHAVLHEAVFDPHSANPDQSQ